MEREVVGRRDELAAVVALANAERSGFRALVLEGEPGIGKTTIWRAGIAHAEAGGALALVARPTAAETRLPYSAVGDLLRRVPPETIASLPESLASALRVAALLEPTESLADERLVARGLADTLQALAASGKLLVAVDDVQWLDERSRAALAYALRRLADTDARVLLARRPPLGASTDVEDGLPQADVDLLVIGPLSLSALRDIVRERTGWTVPRPALVRVSRAAGGNPYYAIEIARELARAGDAPAGTVRLPKDVRRLTANRILRLPAETRSLLLDLALATRPTVPELGGALAPAVADGVLEIDLDGSVRFAHPLVAAAVIDSATPDERRAGHLELALTTDDDVERARHTALAADPPDAAAASAAADGYKLADERGNTPAALELAELALRLTSRDDVELRLARAIVYADALDAAGATPEAQTVLESEIAAAPADADVGHALVRLGWMCWREDDFPAGVAACRRALAGATELPLLAEIYETLTWLSEDDLPQAYESTLRLVEVRVEQGDPLLESRARLLSAYFGIVTGHAPDRDAIERDIEVMRSNNTLDQNPVPEMWMKFIDRLSDSREILVARLAFAREVQDEQFAVACLSSLGEVDTWLGDYGAARAAFSEALLLSDELAGATYLSSLHACAAQLAAIEGRIADAERHAAEATRSTTKNLVDALACSATGAAALAGGELERARDAFAKATRILEGIGMREPARFRYHGDQIEALVGLGELDAAHELVERMASRLETFERPWLEVQVHRGRALVAGASGDLDGALASGKLARTACARMPMPFERAKTDLVLGRLLRRAKRRGDARTSLEAALEAFEALPAPRWAESTRDELARLGLSRLGDELTDSERAVAEAAARGLKNREIAEQLFMSPKTVEAHLSRTYRKLGVHSRAVLVTKLASRREQG